MRRCIWEKGEKRAQICVSGLGNERDQKVLGHSEASCLCIQSSLFKKRIERGEIGQVLKMTKNIDLIFNRVGTTGDPCGNYLTIYPLLQSDHIRVKVKINIKLREGKRIKLRKD